MRLLRNKLARHECILGHDLPEEYRNLIACASWICLDTASLDLADDAV